MQVFRVNDDVVVVAACEPPISGPCVAEMRPNIVYETIPNKICYFEKKAQRRNESLCDRTHAYTSTHAHSAVTHPFCMLLDVGARTMKIDYQTYATMHIACEE